MEIAEIKWHQEILGKNILNSTHVMLTDKKGLKINLTFLQLFEANVRVDSGDMY